MYSDKKNDTLDAGAAIFPFVLFSNSKDDQDDLENQAPFLRQCLIFFEMFMKIAKQDSILANG